MNPLRRIKSSLQSTNATLDKIGAKGWDRFLLFFDLYYCRKILHATDDEYIAYKFYNLKNRFRKNFYLIYHQRKYIRYLNTGGFTLSKYRFYSKIPNCFDREMILAPTCGKEMFIKFVKAHKTIVVKPDQGSYGRDIRTLTYTNDEEMSAFFDSLTEPSICEEFIVQHDILNQLNPGSVNTVRILTLRKDDSVEVISASLRIGNNKERIVDNMRKGGIGAQVDVETGIIITYGYDYDGNKFISHPTTGCNILGLQLPNWDKVIELVKTAHSELPQCELLGWDIAMTQKGADIIEANTAPGPMLTQFMDLEPKGEQLIKKAKENKKARIVHGKKRSRKEFRQYMKLLKK